MSILRNKAFLLPEVLLQPTIFISLDIGLNKWNERNILIHKCSFYKTNYEILLALLTVENYTGDPEDRLIFLYNIFWSIFDISCR